MRIAIIGAAGHWGYVPHGSRGPDLDPIIAVAPGGPDEDVTKVLEACHAAGHPTRLFDDYRQMLDGARVDLVAVNPRYHRNAEVAVTALQRNLHCFLEKPVALTLEDLDRVWKVYSAHSGQMVPMLPMRCEPGYLGAWRAVRAGDIGEVRLITAQKSYRLGSRPDFYRERDKVGGLIPWVGSHAIDLVRWFAAKPFVSVAARHSCMGNRDMGELEATALCQFVLEDEILASVNLDYLRPEGAPGHGDDRIRVAGTDGVVEVRDGRAWLSNQQHGPQEVTASGERQLFRDFVAMCEGRGECLLNAQDAFAVTRTCLLARQSADEGRGIDL